MISNKKVKISFNVKGKETYDIKYEFIKLSGMDPSI